MLHDVTSITNKDYTENHHIIGVEIAEEILNNDISKEKIMLIKKCILNHRGSVLNEKNTLEDIWVSNADTMSHFYIVLSLLRMVYVEKDMPIDDGADFVFNKLQRSYNKLSKMGKEIIIPQYEASKILLMKK